MRGLRTLRSGFFFFMRYRPLPISPSDHFGSERHDLHELALAELAGDRSEDARPDGLFGIVDDDRGIVVELDVAAVLAPLLLDRAHDDRLDHGALLHGAIRSSFLDRSGDHVTEPAVLASRA